jgi:hypothetical protein
MPGYLPYFKISGMTTYFPTFETASSFPFPGCKGRFPLGGILRVERNLSLSCDFSGDFSAYSGKRPA